MRSIATGAAARRLLCLASFAALVALTGCTGDEEQATGSPFTQALAKDYGDLANQAAALPAPVEEGGLLDSLDIFGLFSGGNPNDDLSKAFQEKAATAENGEEPPIEAAPADPSSEAIRARLARDLGTSKDQLPAQAARAQADYDCWVMAGTVPSAAAMSRACRAALDGSLAALEGGARPAPFTPPPPPPIQSAPVPAPAPVQAPAPMASDFTVYFEFDSWTLTAEDLKVITDVINAARSGGQTHITIVGHTDTSGSAAYNQKLSVRRANVVVEALVDLGARRAAIKASGVGETDLAVQTGDNIKEAKNRRGVITLQP